MQQWYKCPQCGADLIYGTNPCPKCKASLAWSQQGPAVFIPTIGAPQQQTVHPTTSRQSSKKAKNPVLLTLAIISGCVLLVGTFAIYIGKSNTKSTSTTNNQQTADNAQGPTSNTSTTEDAGTPTPVGISHSEFAVNGVSVSVSPSSYEGECPSTFNFSGHITANGPGTVTYRWEHSDGTSDPSTTVNFMEAGTIAVSTSWILSIEGFKGLHWGRLHVLTPNDTLSNQAMFSLNCIPRFTVTNVSLSVNPPYYWSKNCSGSVNFIANVTANGPGTITYEWELSNDTSVPIVRTTHFGKAGTITVNTGWSLWYGGTFWGRLHVLTPNDTLSNQAMFTIDCKPK